MIHLPDFYVGLEGKKWPLSNLDVVERRFLIAVLKESQRLQNAPGDPLERWCDFDNYWTPKIMEFYADRGLKSNQIVKKMVFEIAQDLSGRMAVSFGLSRLPNYRDSLEEIIASKFKSRRAFCKASGLSEDMLSHVLAGRK